MASYLDTFLARLRRRFEPTAVSPAVVEALADAVPQSEPIPGTVPNSAGGHAFPVDDWTRLDRFLILGTEGGSYYASERALTRDNAAAVLRAIAADGPRAVARIVAVSEAGRAPKADPALFALALAASAEAVETRRLALAALPRVARTGTQLFRFAGFVEGLRGWGRGLRRAVGGWYAARPVAALAYQAVKYRQREGWSHRDLLRLSHPQTAEPARRDLFDWVCRGTAGESLPALLRAADTLARTTDPAAAAALIRAHDLPREAVPGALLNEAVVWEALLDRMPLGALVRSLAKLTAVGVLRPFGERVPDVLSALGDAERIRRARLHPLAILLALRTYAQGRGDRGKLVWEPVQAVVDALNAAFHTAFATVEPTGKRLLLALDVSGSMAAGRVAGTALTPREASAAMALMTAATEPQTQIVGFTSADGNWNGRPLLRPLPLSPSMRLDDAVRAVSDLPFGGTDCALPMLHALEHGLSVDAFVVYTDSETWAGAIHPAEALRRYRERTGIAAKLVVVGMVSNGFSIADPDDAGMLDVVGFDAAAPALIADFIRGD
ncbi:TROVE domain-containing protein [Roseomonas sp. NAR14]|uniref:TROVE domain-containing protein n=1 Tax=Roseomonas acroporae TaxID=2937791 RepID=A0A9X1Y633_9PROT|nr:TROVE domain-containing protein [Roseomonas acroporae]MCK8784191.1 TROVE domain-containing protein [Roseomonas acroporae]